MKHPLRQLLGYSFLGHILFALLMALLIEWSAQPHRPEEKITYVTLKKGWQPKTDAVSAYKKAKELPKSKKTDPIKVDEPSEKNTKPLSKVQQFKETQEKKVTPEPSKVSPETKPKKQAAVPDAKDAAIDRVNDLLKQRQREVAQAPDEGGGQSTTGTEDTYNNDLDPELLAYRDKVIAAIKAQWVVIPREGSTLKTVVDVMINAEGQVVMKEVASPSGDASFDLSVMRAIERASPFPPVPESVRRVILSEGLSIEFNPHSVSGG